MAHVDTDTAHTAPATVGAKENRVIWLLPVSYTHLRAHET